MKSRLVFLLLFIALNSFALADRGSIPYRPGVKIFEPNQKALIAWDGEEQILILSTDLRASSPTRVLEVLPLPSRPTVKKGSVESFRKAVRFINRGNQMATTRYKGGAVTRSPAGRVVERKKIGAHNIAVVQVLDPKRFTSWVQETLDKDGVKQKKIPAVLSSSVQEYIDDGFTWFVFDTVELGSETVTQDAIIYKFATDKLYYPLRISRTDEGETEITLVILTPKMLSEFPGLPIKQVRLEHEPVTIGQSELKQIDKDIAALLRSSQELKLRIWKLRGRLDSFHQDLLAH
jgi:hypothetical protein